MKQKDFHGGSSEFDKACRDINIAPTARQWRKWRKWRRQEGGAWAHYIRTINRTLAALEEYEAKGTRFKNSLSRILK